MVEMVRTYRPSLGYWNTYIVSDTHFGHDKVVDLCHRPKNWVDILFRSWYQRVNKNDTVIHLGDLALMDRPDPFWKDIKSLPGRKYLLRGNHDTLSKAFYLEKAGFIVVEPDQLEGSFGVKREQQFVTFSHQPLTTDDLFDWDINIHGHIHNYGWPSHITNMNKDHRNVSLDVMDYKVVLVNDVFDNGKFEGPPIADAMNV